MKDPHLCSRCQTAMERGFVAEEGVTGHLVARWCAGQPTKGVLGGMGEVDSKQHREGIPIASLRCPKCGFLEFFAQRSS